MEADNSKTIPSNNLDEVIITASGAAGNLNAAQIGRHVIGNEAIMKLPVLFPEQSK